MTDIPFSPRYINPEEEPKEESREEETIPFFPENTKQLVKHQKGLINNFMKGFTQESAAGSLAQLIDGAQEKMSVDDSFGSQLVQGAGAMAGDLPFMAIGGKLGALLGAGAGSTISPFGTGAGAFLGGGFGAMAFPTFIKEAVKEYQDYQKEGNDLTFGEFLQRADNLASKTLNSGLLGSILGVVSESMGALAKIPMFKKMFDTKYVGKAAERAFRATGVGTAATAASGAAERRLPSKEELAANILMAGGFEATGAAIGTTKKFMNSLTKEITPGRFWDSKDAIQLKEELIGEGTKEVPRETQEAALDALRSMEQPKVERPASETKGITPKALEKPVSKLAEKTFVDRTERLAEYSPETKKAIEGVGKELSKEPFDSYTKAGENTQKMVKAKSKEDRKEVSKAYKEAKEVYSGQKGKFPNLVKDIEERIKRIKRSKVLSRGQQFAVKKLEQLKYALSEDGKPQDISIEELIKTSDSIGSELGYGTIEPDARNILKPVVAELNKAGIDLLESRGINSKLIKKADKLHGDWANKYLIDEIEPFLDSNEKHPEKLNTRSKDPGTYRSLKAIFGEDKTGKSILSKIERDIVEDSLSKYTTDIEKVGSNEYSRTIETLKDITQKKNEVSNVDKYLRDRKEKYLKSQEKPTPRKPTSIEKKIAETGKRAESLKKNIPPIEKERITSFTKTITPEAKWLKRKPEDVAKQLSTRTGIRDLKKELYKTKNGRKIFDSLTTQKLSNIFEEGKISKDSTTQDVYNVINKRENFEIVSEIIGERDAKNLLEQSKKLASEKKFTKATLIKLMKDSKLPILQASGAAYVIYKVISKILRLFNPKDDRD